jgi:hypothetical protein
VLLFLPGSARLRPETPDLTIRLVLQDRVLTATTRRTLSDTASVRLRLRPPRSETIVIGTPQRVIGHQWRVHSGTRGLSDRPPPSAAPRSDRLPDRLATPKWLVRQGVC